MCCPEWPGLSNEQNAYVLESQSGLELHLFTVGVHSSEQPDFSSPVLHTGGQWIYLHATYQTGPLMATETPLGYRTALQALSWPLYTLHTPVASILRGLGPGQGPPHHDLAGALYYFPCIHLHLMTGRDLDSCGCTCVHISQHCCESVNGRDWFSLQVNRLLQVAFAGLCVAFMDTWEMTSSLSLPSSILFICCPLPDPIQPSFSSFNSD